MDNFKDKLMRFMSGRYGIDELYYALIAVSIILIAVNSFVYHPILDTLVWFVLILMIFRAFSRNIVQRRLENEKFMKLWKPVKTNLKLTKHRITDIKTHRFRRCPHCQAMLRLPRNKGVHTVSCPRCHNKFKLHILW